MSRCPPKPPLGLEATIFYLERWPNRKVRRAALAWLKKLSRTCDWE